MIKETATLILCEQARSKNLKRSWIAATFDCSKAAVARARFCMRVMHSAHESRRLSRIIGKKGIRVAPRFDDKNIFAAAYFVVARIRSPNIQNADRIIFKIFSAFQHGDARVQHVSKNSLPR